MPMLRLSEDPIIVEPAFMKVILPKMEVGIVKIYYSVQYIRRSWMSDKIAEVQVPWATENVDSRSRNCMMTCSVR